MDNSKTKYIDDLMNFKRQRNTLVIILMLIITGFIIFFRYHQDIKNNLTISKQNNKALLDSVRVEKNKNDDLVYSKNTFISDNEELKNLNNNLYEKLQEQRGKVSELNEIVANIDNTPVYIETEVIKYVDKDTINGNKYGLKWDYDTTYNTNNSRKLSGLSKFKLNSGGNVTPIGTEITEDIIKFGLLTGLREKDGNIEIFATSKYPNLVITDLNGAIINPKKHPIIKKYTKPKRFSIGPYIGGGLNFNMVPTKSVNLGFQVGIGIHYNIISF